jgi:hypothetical protein
MNSILTLNFIIVIVLVVGIRYWQRRHGRLSEKRTALIISGYFSFFVLTTFLPLFEIDFWLTILIEIVLLVVVWGIGYPWARWLYSRFNSSK